MLFSLLLKERRDLLSRIISHFNSTYNSVILSLCNVLQYPAVSENEKSVLLLPACAAAYHCAAAGCCFFHSCYLPTKTITVHTYYCTSYYSTTVATILLATRVLTTSKNLTNYLLRVLRIQNTGWLQLSTRYHDNPPPTAAAGSNALAASSVQVPSV